MLTFTALGADEIMSAIQRGEIQDRVSGALAIAWAGIRQRAEVTLVSGGISKEETHALPPSPAARIDQENPPQGSKEKQAFHLRTALAARGIPLSPSAPRKGSS